jgi:S1-C subfamily serine protease|tara:strand:+ start:66164 stop:67030 length:867 start_codon:yes stop_codon:yes gene_type:complete
MFKTAYEIASKFTQPLILSYRFYDKSVATGLGTFIILNNDGWIITAAHNLAVSSLYVQHQKEIHEYNAKVEAINQLHENQKEREFKNLKPNPKWITNFFIWLGNDGIKVEESHVYNDHDIAFLRVDKSVFNGFTDFPKIKNPNNIKIGASLCKLGFPFHSITATFEEQNKQFRFPPELFPIPRFPIEGIYTRNIVEGKSQDGTMDVMYIETSSPGLKGQSGGPIVDLDGNIYAVQSKNVTMPLGFTGFVETNGKRVEENQFINVGIGVHTNTIVSLLNKHGIKFEIAE